MEELELRYKDEYGDEVIVKKKFDEMTKLHDLVQTFVYFLRGISYNDDTIKHLINMDELDD